MKITIELNTDNAAWEDNGTAFEFCQALNFANVYVESMNTATRENLELFGTKKILDSNGNATGTITITEG